MDKNVSAFESSFVYEMNGVSEELFDVLRCIVRRYEAQILHILYFQEKFTIIKRWN